MAHARIFFFNFLKVSSFCEGFLRILRILRIVKVVAVRMEDLLAV